MNEGWLAGAAGTLKTIRTPLSLGGLSVIVLCIIYNRIIGLGIFTELSGDQTVGLLGAIVQYVFWLAIVAVVLGVAGFLVKPRAQNK